MTAGRGSPSSQVAEVLARVLERGGRERWPVALVEACREAVGADGVGLAVADAEGPFAVAAATAGLGQAGEDLQFTLGEGPCRLAAATGVMVHSPDLSSDTRWLHYSREAGRAGILAAFSAPLQVGAVRLGVLDIYRRRPGPLGGPALRAVHVHTEAAVALLLMMADEDQVLAPLDDVSELADIRPVVHQAAGMVAIQLDVTLEVALARLRAAAFAAERPLRDVASDVVARRIGLDHTVAGVHPRDDAPLDDDGRDSPERHQAEDTGHPQPRDLDEHS